VLNAASKLKLKLGRIDIRFSKPFSLRQWMHDQNIRRSSATSLFSPMYNPAHKATLLQALGYTVLADINAVSVIMPTALVGTIILTLRGALIFHCVIMRSWRWKGRAWPPRYLVAS
jgi:glycerol-3-phosphate O-acyltransferase